MEDGGQTKAVIMYETGNVGCYNRGNRSIGHFLENCLPILVTLPVGFLIFPFPSAMCLITYSLARVVYQIGYTSYGFGAHLPGFYIEKLSAFTMLGLIFISAVHMMP